MVCNDVSINNYKFVIASTLSIDVIQWHQTVASLRRDVTTLRNLMRIDVIIVAVDHDVINSPRYSIAVTS